METPLGEARWGRHKGVPINTKGTADLFGAVDQIRSRWISNLSHDFSGLLLSSRGYLRMALDEKNGPLTERQRRYLVAAMDNIVKIITLARELNQFPEAAALALEVVHIPELLTEAARSARVTSGNNTRLMEDFSGLLITSADRKKLAAALEYVIVEAIQFAGPRGVLEIAAREKDGEIVIEIAATGEPATPGETAQTPETASVASVFRLHGGAVSVSRPSLHNCLISLGLPIIRQSECGNQPGDDWTKNYLDS